MIKVIHIVINLEVFIERFLKSTMPQKILTPLPKDAQIIHFEYDSELKELHLYFTSEKGYLLREGQVFSSVPTTDLIFKEVRENE